jgi:hypothetical protein
MNQDVGATHFRPLPKPAARMLAFYLPQFHPIPENDAWWGAGFTEWTNVAKARPLFPGHVQPRLPADLGFYDLRVPEVRIRQAELARAAGIEGFCYWHYWFGEGRRILERPFDEVLAGGEPDFPFALAWANHSWTRTWRGMPGQSLIAQTYPGRADEAAHFAHVRRAFEDPRYFRVDGRPLFVVFAPHNLPDAKAFVEHWRELAHRAGFPGLYMVGIANRYRAGIDRYGDPILAPFDAVTPLTPQDYLEDRPMDPLSRARRLLRTRRFGATIDRLTGQRLRRPAHYDYADVVRRAMSDMPNEPRYLPGVLSGWDNTPRSGLRGFVFENATPELLAAYLQKALSFVRDRPPQQAIVFLKAWNEWAEGNYVEPDQLYGHAYLDAIRAAMLPQSQMAVSQALPQ